MKRSFSNIEFRIQFDMSKSILFSSLETHKMFYIQKELKTQNLLFSVRNLKPETLVAMDWILTNSFAISQNSHFKTVTLKPLLLKESSLQVEILFVCPSFCTSSLQHFQYRAFKSSQNHVKPHILYIIGKRWISDEDEDDDESWWLL